VAVAEVPSIMTPRLELVSLSAAFMRASLDGPLDEAASELGAKLPESWPDPWQRFLQIRLADLDARPATRPLLLRGIILREPIRELIGIVGFHGPPDDDRSVEIGYAVEAEHRQHGYAAEAAQALCAWAASEHAPEQIGSVRASISPQNEPSLRLIRRLDFMPTGRHWDDEDGWELTFVRVVQRV
jgi:ribosomal-protein-alanine N-acetyltransferase